MRRAFLLGLLALSACASAPAGTPRRFSGTFEFQFETASFRPDTGGGRYWLAADGRVWRDVIAPIERSGAGPWGSVLLVVEGYLSVPGQYGHLGAYERELWVTRVIDAQLITADGPPSGS